MINFLIDNIFIEFGGFIFQQTAGIPMGTNCDDKRDDFIFFIVNYPFLDSNIPSSPAYVVFMSQLIRYSRTCNSYRDQHLQSFLVVSQ